MSVITEILLRVCESNSSNHREDCIPKIFIDIVLMNCGLKI